MNATNPVDPPRVSGNVIPAHHVQMVRTQAPSPTATARPHLLSADHGNGTAEPRISVIKEGDTVRSIEITCSCGEVIRFACEY
jgi:hypothetical protein